MKNGKSWNVSIQEEMISSEENRWLCMCLEKSSRGKKIRENIIRDTGRKQIYTASLKVLNDSLI